MDEATLFKFGKWVECGRVHCKFPLKGAWSGSRDPLKNLPPFSIPGMDEATLFKFGKWIDYSASLTQGKNFPQKGAWSKS